MSSEYPDHVIPSEVPDTSDLPLDTEDLVADAEAEHVMRQIGLTEGEQGTTVAAFNSSI